MSGADVRCNFNVRASPQTSKRPPSCSLGSVRKMTTTKGVESTCQRSTGLSGMLCGLATATAAVSVNSAGMEGAWRVDASSLVVCVPVLDAHGVGHQRRAGDLRDVRRHFCALAEVLDELGAEEPGVEDVCVCVCVCVWKRRKR